MKLNCGGLGRFQTKKPFCGLSVDIFWNNTIQTSTTDLVLVCQNQGVLLLMFVILGLIKIPMCWMTCILIEAGLLLTLVLKV